MSNHSVRGAPVVSNLRFTPAPELDAQTGLLGWIATDIIGFHLDGLALRRTTAGHLLVVYPARRAKDGRKYAFARPIDPATEAAIAEQIITALVRQGVLR